jgi:steroid delta-isomerase-like uncharacterized protein
LGPNENKAIAASALEGVWSVGGTLPLEDVYGPDFVGHQLNSSGDGFGLKELRSFIAEFHRAFPDFLDTIDRQVAEDQLVASQFTSAGTHRGDFMGIAATGRRAEWSGIEIVRISNGKIAENWVSWDQQGMLQQIGNGR